MEARKALTFSMLAVGIGVISLGLLVSTVMAAAPAPTTIKVGIQSVEQMAISDLGKKMIFSDNARKLLRLPI